MLVATEPVLAEDLDLLAGASGIAERVSRLWRQCSRIGTSMGRRHLRGLGEVGTSVKALLGLDHWPR